MNKIRHLILLLLLGLSCPATAQQGNNPRQLGPFRLGMTFKQLKFAAVKAGFAQPRRQLTQERDLMGLGLFGVQPITLESTELKPKPNKIWKVEAYVLSNRVAYLSVDFGLEDSSRAARWFERFEAPSNVRKNLIDTSWAHQGVVLHAERFGRSLHMVDWIGLNRSNRVLVNLTGAITVANKFFRGQKFQEAEAGIELIRQQVIQHFQRPRADGNGFQCKPPPSVELSPTEDVCADPSKRFPTHHKKWSAKTWRLLGIEARRMSRYYSFGITSSGEGLSTRITLIATGNLDCDDSVSMVQVRLRADPARDQSNCRLNKGQWEVINPLE